MYVLRDKENNISALITHLELVGGVKVGEDEDLRDVLHGEAVAQRLLAHHL